MQSNGTRAALGMSTSVPEVLVCWSQSPGDPVEYTSDDQELGEPEPVFLRHSY